jgi:hypothetical protein
MISKLLQAVRRSISWILARLKLHIEPIRLVFDFAVIVVMVFTLRSSNESVRSALSANELSRQSLRSSYIPWLKLVRFNILQSDTTATFVFGFKNFSPTAPAVNLSLHMLVPRVINERTAYLRDALMPGEEGNQTFSMSSIENRGVIADIEAGRHPVRFSVRFLDALGIQHQIEEEFIRIGTEYRRTDYAPSIDTSLTSNR